MNEKRGEILRKVSFADFSLEIAERIFLKIRIEVFGGIKHYKVVFPFLISFTYLQHIGY